ncbi:MAG TPA: hypothetical protein VJX31_11065 [Casimicrobiaceae bacterium]|nr:hypothetical protein [Casimicrobiaceae bacterium]
MRNNERNSARWDSWPRAAVRALLALVAWFLPLAVAHAALVMQSTDVSGGLLYSGLGDIGGGVGSGRYTFTDCAFDGVNTTCSLTGRYTETAQSMHAPGQSGEFTLRMRYFGSGITPVIAHSDTAGSDVLRFTSVGDTVFTLTMFPDSGGILTGLYPAANFPDSIAFAAFLDPAAYSCTGLPAGRTCGIGQVGLVAGATISGGVKPLVITVPNPAPPTSAPNYQGLWWAAPAGAESGWGINFAHQGNTIFATWFTYDASGKAAWYVMTAQKTGAGTFAGSMYQTNGPAFNAVPFDPAGVTAIAVGTGTLAFSSATAGTFTYTVNGITQAKAIVPQIFGPAPMCVFGAQPDLSKATNYQDLWWASPAGSQSGWGINLTHQGATIFATWFTYGADHNPLWYVVTAMKTADRTYKGTLYRTVGPPFNAMPFDPHAVQATPVGDATFVFADGNRATFAYNVNDGANVGSQTKSITREIFASPGTVCN